MNIFIPTNNCIIRKNQLQRKPYNKNLILVVKRVEQRPPYTVVESGRQVCLVLKASHSCMHERATTTNFYRAGHDQNSTADRSDSNTSPGLCTPLPDRASFGRGAVFMERLFFNSGELSQDNTRLQCSLFSISFQSRILLQCSCIDQSHLNRTRSV